MHKKHNQRDDVYRNRLQYWKQIKHMMEMHELKDKSILFRKKLLDDAKKTNYTNEYNRIRGILAHSVVDQQTKQNIENRMTELSKLGIA